MDENIIIRKEFYRLAKFPGVIGCIDGTHVRIQVPSTDEPAYVIRKGFHSINVQAICNHQGKFTNVVARWPGSTHDSHVFKMSQLGQRLQNQRATLQTGIILGDSGYACRPFVMTPYMRTTSEDQENFNSAHKRTRVIIERAFGWWKRRFHVLHGEIRLSPERACTIIGACAVLHDIAFDLREPMFEREDEEEREGDFGADCAGREDG